MTADRLAPGSRASGSGGSERAQDALPATTILSMCDRLLGEVGRRHHMFAWLRAPGSSSGGWLAVDAYYPRNRLVVMCRSRAGPHDALYRELIPKHRLKFLALDPGRLGSDDGAVEAALARMLFGPPAASAAAPPAEPPAVAPKPVPAAPRTDPVAVEPAAPAPGTVPPAVAPGPATTAPRTNPPTVASEPATEAPSTAAAPPTKAREPATEAPSTATAPPTKAPEPPNEALAVYPGTVGTAAGTAATASPATTHPRPDARPPRPPAPVRAEWGPVRRRRTALAQGLLQLLGVILGLAAAAGLIAELYLGLIRVAFIDDRIVLAVAIVLDVCARALGTVAAERARDRIWACLCAIGGSPVVAIYSLLWPSGRAKVEPAPLAGVLGLLASAIAVVALLTGH